MFGLEYLQVGTVYIVTYLMLFMFLSVSYFFRVLWEIFCLILSSMKEISYYQEIFTHLLIITFKKGNIEYICLSCLLQRYNLPTLFLVLFLDQVKQYRNLKFKRKKIIN